MQLILVDEGQLARFKQKFAHLSEFFHLLEAIRGQNNTFSLRWKCNVCELDKILKSDSISPTSNLKKHVSKCHPETLSSFLTLRDYKKSSNAFIQAM